MSEKIVALDEHRFKDLMKGVALTVVGHPFEIEGVPMSLTWNMEVRDGDYKGSIEEIRKAGGIYMKRQPTERRDVVPAVVEHRGYSGYPSRVTLAQEASATFRRKQIYEELHPETKHGGDRKSDQVANSATRSDRFTSATSEATGKSERAVRMAAARGEALGLAKTRSSTIYPPKIFYIRLCYFAMSHFTTNIDSIKWRTFSNFPKLSV